MKNFFIKIKEFIIKQWLLICYTEYGRLIYALVLTVLFQFLSDRLDNDTLGYIGLVFFLYIIYIALKFILYALIINPGKDFITWLKKLFKKEC